MSTQEKKKSWKWILAILLIGGFIYLSQYSSLSTYFDKAYLKELIEDAGPYGIVLFFLVFLAGSYINIPGILFVVLAVYLYGYLWGTVIAYIFALSIAFILFYTMRLLGANKFKTPENKYIKKLLDNVVDQPIKSITLIRIFMLLSPLVNYTLAVTQIKKRHFLLGNAIGMLIPFIVIVGSTFIVDEGYLISLQNSIKQWFN